MHPSLQVPTTQPVRKPRSRKTWLLVSVLAIGLLIAGVIIFLLFNSNSTRNQAAETAPPTTNPADLFSFKPAVQPTIYAGNSVYDACNFIGFTTLKKTIPNFTKLLNTLGTKERATNPVVMRHNYFDHNIAQVLGEDAQPHKTGTIINAGGALNANPFISPHDSNCEYGQANDQSFVQSSEVNNSFAKIYVTQKPTPLSAEFLQYLSGLKPFTDHSFANITIYATPEKDSNGFYTGVYVAKDKSTAVIFKTGIAALFEAASDDIAATLSKAPTGPLTVTYPKPYIGTPHPCKLFTAEDFNRFSGKTASALTEDAIVLTEVGNNSVRRECKRLETDRDVLKSNITSSNITITQARSTNDARNYMEAEKRNSLYTVSNVKARIALGDEAFIRKKESANALQNPYALVLRAGSTVMSIELSLDMPDASSEAFEGRIIPLAQAVLAKL